MQVLDHFDQPADILDMFSKYGCDFGLLHGALDAYALKPFNASEWVDLVRA
jgi:hypothetical protein